MPQDLDRFEDLVSGYLDEDLGEAEAEELAKALSGDSEKLDLFVSRAMLEAELQRRGETAAALGQSKRERLWGRRTGRQWLGSLVAAAAVLALGGLVLYLIRVRDQPAFAQLRVSPHATLSVSGQSEETKQGTLAKGSTLSITQGSAEIKFEEGVRCVLQSPGSLNLTDTGRVRLLEGTARFTVEEQAQGFRVATDLLQIVDLGTEFGIDLSVPDQPQVHVLKGEVEVRSLKGRKQTSRLEQGRAVALGAVGTLQPVPPDAKRFPNELPTGIPAVRFSFDQRIGDVLPATGALAEQAGVHLSLDHERAPTLGPGRFGQALSFDRDNCYAQTNWMGIGGVQARTISLWLRVPRIDRRQSYPLLGWGTWRGAEKMSNLGLRLGMREDRATLRLVSGHRWLQGGTVLNDGNWHHVVVCIGEYSREAWPATTIYVDGSREEWTARVPEVQGAAPIDSFFTEVKPSNPLIFGQFNDPEETQILPNFRGQLDEVIIAAGLLTEEQVKALYEGRLEDSGLDLGS